jgi:putative transposase
VERIGLLEMPHPAVSVRRQCMLLSLNRSGLYYQQREADATNATLMRRLDELYTAHPFLGYT